jgi:hypothetical protein
MVQKRLEFARRYRHWTNEQWVTVMWSDESNFSVVHLGRQRVRHPSRANRTEERNSKSLD